MIEMTITQNGKDTVIWKVYENRQEADEAGIIVKQIDQVQAGDYFLSKNGYYVPVMSAGRYNKRHPRNVRIKIPNDDIWIYSRKDGTVCNTSYWFDRDQKPGPKKEQLNPRRRLFATYLAKGMDIYKAYNMVFTKDFKMITELNRMIMNKAFVEYLMETINNKESLADALNKYGASNEWLVSQLVKLSEDEKTPVSLRGMALSQIIRLKEMAEKGDIPTGEYINKAKRIDYIDVTSKSLPIAPQQEDSLAVKLSNG